MTIQDYSFDRRNDMLDAEYSPPLIHLAKHGQIEKQTHDLSLTFELQAQGSSNQKTIDRSSCWLESTWILLLLLGILASILAWSIDEIVLHITQLHAQFTHLGDHWFSRYGLYLLFRVGIVLLGVTITYCISPNSAGSGIPGNSEFEVTNTISS